MYVSYIFYIGNTFKHLQELAVTVNIQLAHSQ